MKKLILFLLLLFTGTVFSQFESPKSELRGVWVATVTNIDWPYVQGTSSLDIKNQKNQLISIFNSHKSYGLNTIFFQVRTICDALYKSNYEPWSSYLTGSQGTAPSDTSYDPLKFAVQEAHKRGMELHAWLNPYRAELSGGSPVSVNHVINKHPEWIIKCNGSEYRFLNPGLPEVRKYVLRIVMDVVERYDVDGIHFDDYFYPYSDYGTFNDDATFAEYPNGFTDRAKWRENNVNLLLKMINDSIKAVKPWVKFGVSPSGNPSVNTSIYCNPGNWLAGNYIDSAGSSYSGSPYIDYIMPQLYWENYGGYLGSWTGASFLNGRHLYIGQAAYRYTEFSGGELSWEISTNRNTSTIRGGVFFSSKSLTSNYKNCNDTLRYRYFTHPAITPQMEWKDSLNNKPDAPANLRFEINSSTGKYELHWDKPPPPAGADTAFVYVVYRSENNPPDISNSSNIFGLTGLNYLSADDAKYSVTKGNYYGVTAVDRYSNESVISNVASLDLASLIPEKPALISPTDNNHELGNSITLIWSADTSAERYIAQVSTDSTFNSGTVLLVGEFRNTQINFNSIIPGKTYYWRIKAFGQVGESEYSDVYSFQSGIPLSPVLITPAHTSTGVSLTPLFTWFSSENASSYRIQVSTTVQFHDNTFVIDTTTNDTVLQASAPLTPNKIYYWRANAQNTYGTSSWSAGFGFKTTPTLIVETDKFPKEYSLEQNYPNPFNPATKIRFSLPHSSFVTLKIYNLLGQEVETLINNYKNEGDYEISFDASDLAAGIYVYRLVTEKFSSSKKMVLLK
jgi:uncharacterized lipoprotein YddW (UPF0748 family)